MRNNPSRSFKWINDDSTKALDHDISYLKIYVILVVVLRSTVEHKSERHDLSHPSWYETVTVSLYWTVLDSVGSRNSVEIYNHVCVETFV